MTPSEFDCQCALRLLTVDRTTYVVGADYGLGEDRPVFSVLDRKTGEQVLVDSITKFQQHPATAWLIRLRNRHRLYTADPPVYMVEGLGGTIYIATPMTPSGEEDDVPEQYLAPSEEPAAPKRTEPVPQRIYWSGGFFEHVFPKPVEPAPAPVCCTRCGQEKDPSVPTGINMTDDILCADCCPPTVWEDSPKPVEPPPLPDPFQARGWENRTGFHV